MMACVEQALDGNLLPLGFLVELAPGVGVQLELELESRLAAGVL